MKIHMISSYFLLKKIRKRIYRVPIIFKIISNGKQGT